MTMKRWFRSCAAVLLVLFPAIVFSHIHINPIIDHAKALSDFTLSWASFQSLADILKAAPVELRKKEDILKLQTMGSDLKKRIPSVQKNFQDSILKIGESGNDTPAFDTAIADELSKTPGATSINALLQKSAGARATIRSFSADGLTLETDNILAELTGGTPKALKTATRPSCTLFASLQVFGLVSECAQCSDSAQKRFAESKCSTR